MYLPSVVPKTTNERQRRRECCSSARHRDTDRAAPRSTAGLPRRRLATGSEVARNWYPSDPCPIKRVVVLFLAFPSALPPAPLRSAPNSREDLFFFLRDRDPQWRRGDFSGRNASSNPRTDSRDSLALLYSCEFSRHSGCASSKVTKGGSKVARAKRRV